MTNASRTGRTVRAGSPRRKKATEGALQRNILSALEASGYWAQRINSGKALLDADGKKRVVSMAKKGTPDILVIDPYGWLEVKLIGQDLNADQKKWRDKALKRGVRVATVRAVGEALSIVSFWDRQDHHRVDTWISS